MNKYILEQNEMRQHYVLVQYVIPGFSLESISLLRNPICSL